MSWATFETKIEGIYCVIISMLAEIFFYKIESFKEEI